MDEENFSPWYRKYQGQNTSLLLLDNFRAHKDLDDPSICSSYGIDANIHVEFLQPNVTSQAHPFDMGIISALK